MTPQDSHPPPPGHDAPDPPDAVGAAKPDAVIPAGRESGSVDISVEHPLVRPRPSPYPGGHSDCALGHPSDGGPEPP